MSIVKIEADLAAGGSLQLSPIDIACRGRSIPMVWFYRDALDPDVLTNALRAALVSYPVLSGRYASPARAINLSNEGCAVHVVTAEGTVADAVARFAGGAAPCFFQRPANEAFVPPKAGMDPDAANPDTPLLAVQITNFSGGGAAVGVLIQHGVVDAEAAIDFATAWSRAARGLELEAVNHERCAEAAFGLEGGGSASDADADAAAEPAVACFRRKVVPEGEQNVPEFMAVMPKIMGPGVTVVPVPASALQAAKAAASAAPLPEGAWVSTDDVLTARVWKAKCAVRCGQLGLLDPCSCEEITTCSRALNVRKRTEPPLGPCYFANATINVLTELSVRELLGFSEAEVALRLRASVREWTAVSNTIATFARWMHHHQQAGSSTPLQFDAHALTFIVSSWSFDWEAVDFGCGLPFRFDQGCLVPIVAVFTPRPGGDGVDVWTSGTDEAMGQFAERMQQAAAAAAATKDADEVATSEKE
jgi:shikimate O-hydroxycinnamoyltransferase